MSIVTTLSDELDKLRSDICHDCKKRLVPGNVSASSGLNASTATSSASTPFWRRMFQNGQPSRLTVDNAGSSRMSISSPAVPTITSETIPADAPTSESGAERTSISPEPKSEPPEFSVEYNPEIMKRAFDFHLEHVFTHEYPPWSVKISPDGQRMAVGFNDSGATIISETKTRSNDRSVSEFLINSLD